MSSRLTIGEFATVTHLSVRTLRRYHADKLLEPAMVDPFTGYRYYGPEQIPNAQVIHQLRKLDVPLPEIKRMLSTDDAEQREEIIAAQLRSREAELARLQSAVTTLRRLLSREPTATEVELISLPARTVAAVTGTVRLADSVDWYDSAMAELDAVFAPEERCGPPGGHYANELFTDGVGAMTVYRAVRAPRPAGRIEVAELPPAELAVAVHRGPHDDIDVTYGQLGAWVVEHALAVDGPVQETYRVGPRDTSTADDWRTEIGWPVFRVSGKSAARESDS